MMKLQEKENGILGAPSRAWGLDHYGLERLKNSGEGR